MATTIETILIKAAEAGAMTADGADGMMYLGKLCYGGSREGTVTAGKTGNLYDVYKAYLSKATKSEYGSRVTITDDKALRYGVAKLNAFVKFGALPGKTDANWKLVKDAVRVLNEDGLAAGERKIVSRYEQVLKVVRVANATKRTKLSDDEIREALAPKDPVGDQDLKAMERMLKTASQHAEGATDGRGSFWAVIAETIEAQIQNYKSVYVTEAPAEDVEDDDTSLEDFLADPEMGVAA